MSDTDVFEHFSPLDDLVQTAYQGSATFVIISTVDEVEANWTVHVGLVGDEGRWWRGRWTDKDVKNQFGSGVSSFLLESAVEKMADAFVKEQVTVGNWSPSKGADIELVLGTGAKTPIRVPLVELDPAEAAAWAVKTFIHIAVEAKSRKCRLSAYEQSQVEAPAAGTSSSRKATSRRTPSPEPAPRTKHNSPHKTKDRGKDKGREDARPTAGSDRYKRKAEAAEEEIEALKAELEKAKRKGDALMTEPTKLQKSKVAAVARPKGASLANPAKKARKYQALEFADDDE